MGRPPLRGTRRVPDPCSASIACRETGVLSDALRPSPLTRALRGLDVCARLGRFAAVSFAGPTGPRWPAQPAGAVPGLLHAHTSFGSRPPSLEAMESGAGAPPPRPEAPRRGLEGRSRRRGRSCETPARLPTFGFSPKTTVLRFGRLAEILPCTAGRAGWSILRGPFGAPQDEVCGLLGLRLLLLAPSTMRDSLTSPAALLVACAPAPRKPRFASARWSRKLNPLLRVELCRFDPRPSNVRLIVSSSRTRPSASNQIPSLGRGWGKV